MKNLADLNATDLDTNKGLVMKGAKVSWRSSWRTSWSTSWSTCWNNSWIPDWSTGWSTDGVLCLGY